MSSAIAYIKKRGKSQVVVCWRSSVFLQTSCKWDQLRLMISFPSPEFGGFPQWIKDKSNVFSLINQGNRFLNTCMIWKKTTIHAVFSCSSVSFLPTCGIILTFSNTTEDVASLSSINHLFFYLRNILWQKLFDLPAFSPKWNSNLEGRTRKKEGF